VGEGELVVFPKDSLVFGARFPLIFLSPFKMTELDSTNKTEFADDKGLERPFDGVNGSADGVNGSNGDKGANRTPDVNETFDVKAECLGESSRSVGGDE